MLSKLHSRLGTAGFVVAIVALIAALAGTAFAAAGLNSKQKKEVKSIAKSFQGTGPQGPAGPAGPAGTAGAKGADGAAGKDGAGATTAAFTGPKGACTEGGLEVKSASAPGLVCNGKKGSEGPEGPKGDKGAEGNPWTAGGTLPSNATETGTWGSFFNAEDLVPLSFSVPLAAPLDAAHVKVVGEGETAPADCDNGTGDAASPANPEADAGFLCVFVTAFENGGSIPTGGVVDPSDLESGAGKAGAGILVSAGGPALGVGTFAVTAP
ncbi:MAG TPA: hypothetical protein VFX45_08250 [Solirubrobacterales bacterium]|nr:hypothetical protein [Solirubrobacterales bacterium]